jgi:hypothetical protein
VRDVVGAATVYLAAVRARDPAAGLVWQGATYLAWLPPAMALAWLVARVGRPWPARLALFLPATLLHGAASAAITWLVFRARLAPRHAFGPWLADQVLGTFPVEALHYWALVALLAGVEMQRALRERERAAARLETELAQAHLATLRARLQPHFLFNTLQSIALLIPREPVVAQRMTVHLGDLLRAAFARNDAPECTLGDELALVRAYLDDRGPALPRPPDDPLGRRRRATRRPRPRPAPAAAGRERAAARPLAATGARHARGACVAGGRLAGRHAPRDRGGGRRGRAATGLGGRPARRHGSRRHACAAARAHGAEASSRAPAAGRGTLRTGDASLGLSPAGATGWARAARRRTAALDARVVA